MKKLKIVLMGVLVFSVQFIVSATPRAGNDLPSSVSSAFSRQYPAAKMINWTSRGNNYVVNFSTDKEKSAAYYTADGTWLRTDTKIGTRQDLPAAVQNGLAKSRYAHYNIDRMEKVQQPNHRTLYLVRVDYGGDIDWDLYDATSNDCLLYFKPDGTLKAAMNYPDKMASDGGDHP